MYLSLDDFIIRDWTAADAPSVAKYANNRKIWVNLRDVFPHPYTLDHAKQFIKSVTDTDPKTFFAIAIPAEAIGSIGLSIGKDVHRYTAEIGYWLAEPFWGKGIVTRAVQCMTRYAFQKLNLYRVFAEPYATNPASARVLEKAGFQCEGTLHANAYKDDKVIDQHLYSIVNISTHEVRK